MIPFLLFTALAVYFFYRFLRQPYQYSPLWLMLSAWMLALGVPQLNLSAYEEPWGTAFWLLVIASLISFATGFFVFKKIWKKYPFWQNFKTLNYKEISTKILRVIIYGLFVLSAIGLYLFYVKAGNLPLLADDPDAFRFAADEQVPGLINYAAQLARIYIPLIAFLIFWQGFKWKKHTDLLVLALLGVFALIMFASRTQIFFIDLWIMALYLFMRKPNLKQAVKFYPIFLIISVIVLAAIPIVRQTLTYGAGYLPSITGIDPAKLPQGAGPLLPIYIGISFNMQALLHAQNYYQEHALQMGKVTLDPFTNILGLDQFASSYDLGAIFYDWWNTGTYLFPFVQDFGTAAFFFIPFIIAGFLTLAWRYWQDRPQNFLALNLYAYACFFIVMSIYLSFTVRAEMYIDLFLLFIIYLLVTSKKFKQNPGS